LSPAGRHALLVVFGTEPPRHIPISLGADDVLPTGNEWIALPEIRAAFLVAYLDR
jgi:hypothetical protein